MNREEVIARLTAGAGMIREWARDISEERARWKPSPERWSMLEVICHLADEEREDFRRRLDITLHRPDEPWPGIDPPSWVEERRYGDRNFAESVADFLAERERSIAWFRGLETGDWDAAYEHPKLGTLRAGDLLASWLAHDLLHLRQLARLHFDSIGEMTGGYSTDYAGGW